MQQPVPPPLANHVEQAEWLRSLGWNPWNNWGARRRYPTEQPYIEYDPQNRGWYRGDQRIPNFRPRHYWTRPHDGKRPGALGRLKDALTGEGAGVFVTTSGDKRTFMRDRPQKWQWTNWDMDDARKFDFFADPDYRLQDSMRASSAPWAKGSARSGELYNFRTRRYEEPGQPWWLTGGGGQNSSMWRDAQWRPGAKRSDTSPYSYQSPDEAWWSRVPWTAGYYPGGRPVR